MKNRKLPYIEDGWLILPDADGEGAFHLRLEHVVGTILVNAAKLVALGLIGAALLKYLGE